MARQLRTTSSLRYNTITFSKKHIIKWLKPEVKLKPKYIMSNPFDFTALIIKTTKIHIIDCTSSCLIIPINSSKSISIIYLGFNSIV